MQIKKSMGLIRGKSDSIDARNIAFYAYRFKDACKLWTPPRKEIKELCDLYTSRQILLKNKKNVSKELDRFYFYLQFQFSLCLPRLRVLLREGSQLFG